MLFNVKSSAPKMYKDMADIKMSEFKEVDKVDKLLGLDDIGNGCCIRNDVLLDNLFQVRGTVLSDLDNYTSNGIYGINRDAYDIGLCGFGMLIVFSAPGTANGGNPIVQFIINSDGGILTRIKWHVDDWSDWRTISFT